MIESHTAAVNRIEERYELPHTSTALILPLVGGASLGDFRSLEATIQAGVTHAVSEPGGVGSESRRSQLTAHSQTRALNEKAIVALSRNRHDAIPKRVNRLPSSPVVAAPVG
jgi:hypothetical protein